MKNTATRKTAKIMASFVLVVALFAGTFGSFTRAKAAQVLNPDPSRPRFYSKYSTIEEARKAGNALNERIAAEGITLFKNENTSDGTKVLPLANGSRVSLFGSCSTNLRKSGGGSGGGTSNPGENKSIKDIFNQAGFVVNEKLNALYVSKNSRREIPVSNYTQEITDSYKDYSDAAIIFLSRADGAENVDAFLGNGTSRHSQQTDDNERALLAHVKSIKDADGQPLFKRIILCINTADPFEVGIYQDDPRVQGVIWMGMLGSTGLVSLPRILNGEVSPSAHTVDAWAANIRKDPAWFNFGTNGHVGATTNITGKDPSGKSLEGAIAEDGKVGRRIFKALTYKEGIYMGYRWYETAATVDGYFSNVVDEKDYADPLHPDDAYYNRFNGILYPFGYGLSYTTFEWTVGKASLEADEITDKDAGTDITIPVTVKNTGSVAGKDVVQLYVRAPYGPNANIEKSDVTYIDSEKTKLLKPGEEQTINIKFNVRDLACFDWNDINGNGFSGYELEPGDYQLLFRTDSHTDKNEGYKLTYAVTKSICYNSEEKDSPLNYNQGFGENAKAVFSQNDEYNSSATGFIDDKGNKTTKEDADYVTRTNWKLPTPSTPDQLAWSDKALDVMFNHTYTSAEGTNGDKPTDPWYKTASDIPGYGKTRDKLTEGDWKQASESDVAARVNGKTKIQLKDMVGVPFNDLKWTNFLNQLTFNEMVFVTQNNRYKSPRLDAVGKPETPETDGPGQVVHGAKSTFWCCETTIAATYNKQLAYEMGYQTGQECLVLKLYGWYAPGMNTHRLAFNGRNFEYYSSDGRQGGWMAAAVIRGVVENGIHVHGKHLVCNDMETDRNSGGGVSIFLTEQALREIYLKPFELAAKYGNMNGFMTAHGKVGIVRIESHYYLSRYFFYNECGYEGSSVTDAISGGKFTTVVNGSAQQVTSDRLERCFLLPLAWNETPADNDEALNGRKVEGKYDAVNNKIMVPEIFVSQTDWYYSGNSNAQEGANGYRTTVTNSGKWDKESPTQWWSVRMNAHYALFQYANSAAMGAGNGDQIGVYITLNYNDGVSEASYKPCKIGELISEPKGPAVNAAQERFAGWFLDEECTKPAKFPMIVTNPMNLYAQIVPLTAYEQKYDLNYVGAPVAVSQYYEANSVVNLPAFNPVRDGYTFDGWYLEATCVNKAEEVGSLVIESDRTFYAKWIAVKRYTVSFSFNYDDAPMAKTIVVNKGETVEPPVFTPQRKGYVFAGWYTDEGCEYRADFAQGVDYDMELFAKWEQTEIKKTDGCAGNFATDSIVCLIALTGAAAAILVRRKNKFSK